MHPLSVSCHHFVQQLPKSPLPEVSDRRSGTVDCCASKGASTHALHARGLHTPPPLGPTGVAEQEGHLRSAVPHQCGNPSRSGPRSETSRRGDRLLQCVAYLESAAPAPSASPYHHSCRRPLNRSHPLGSLPKQILPPQGGVTQSLSRQIRRRSPAGFPRRPAPLRGKTQTSRQAQNLRCLVTATLPKRLGGLLETPLRWPRIRAAISRPLHPSRGHLQPSAGFLRRWPSHFSLARFGGPQPTEVAVS